MKTHRMAFQLAHKKRERSGVKGTASLLPVLLKGYFFHIYFLIYSKEITVTVILKGIFPSFICSVSFKVVSNTLNYFF